MMVLMMRKVETCTHITIRISSFMSFGWRRSSAPCGLGRLDECSNVSYGQAGGFSNDGYSTWIYRPFRNPTLWREKKKQKPKTKKTPKEFQDLVSLLEGLVRMLMWINLLSYNRLLFSHPLPLHLSYHDWVRMVC